MTYKQLGHQKQRYPENRFNIQKHTNPNSTSTNLSTFPQGRCKAQANTAFGPDAKSASRMPLTAIPKTHRLHHTSSRSAPHTGFTQGAHTLPCTHQNPFALPSNISEDTVFPLPFRKYALLYMHNLQEYDNGFTAFSPRLHVTQTHTLQYVE